MSAENEKQEQETVNTLFDKIKNQESTTSISRLLEAKAEFDKALDEVTESTSLKYFIVELVPDIADEILAEQDDLFEWEPEFDTPNAVSSNVAILDWEAYFDRDTLAVAFRAEYVLENSAGVLKVVFDEDSDAWFFHDTRYDENATPSFFNSNFLFQHPGGALQKAEQWFADQ